MKIMRGVFRVAGFAAALMVLPFLLSCGGGAGSSFTGGGIGGTGVVAQGPITQFGSIFVNGVEYDTSTASVTVNGNSGLVGELQLGMIVTVKGTINLGGTTGSASSIDFKDDLEGPIDSVDSPNNALVVMRQTVFVDSSTVFDPSGTSLSTLTGGDVVEVSGLVDGAGTIHATRIELKNSVTEYEVKGPIKTGSIDTGNMMFQINGLMVNYGMVDPNGMPPLSDNLYIEVKGTNYDNNGAFLATEITTEISEIPTDADHAEIEGFVTSVASSTEFTVGTQPVHIDTPVTINIGDKVEVEGSLVGGILLATTVSPIP